MNTKTIGLLTCLFLFVISGCTNNAPNPPPPAPSAPLATVLPSDVPSALNTIPPMAGIFTSSPPNVTTTGPIKTMPVPSQLGKILLHTEKLFVYVQNENFTQANEELKQIQNEVTELVPTLKLTPSIGNIGADQINNTLATLSSHVNAKQGYESLLQSNQLSRHILDMTDQYLAPLPSGFGRMKLSGREIQLQVQKSDWLAAKTSVSGLRNQWEKVKGMFGNKDSSNILTLDTMLDKLSKDMDNQNTLNLQRDLKNIIDKVDALSQDYLNQK